MIVSGLAERLNDCDQ